MTSLWRIDPNGSLVPINSARLEAESLVENWIENDANLIDSDLLVIGRQVKTGHSGPIDLLGIKSDGSLVIVELKRDKTPREIIAQVLDYASWVTELQTADVYDIADKYFATRHGCGLQDKFKEKFGQPIPEQLNSSHSMTIVASELDEASQRIIGYLANVHEIAINSAFFKIFADQDRRYLTADWLLERNDVEERRAAKKKAPWQGDWYAIFDDNRSWTDMQRYGFFSAGGGRTWSRPLDRLAPGDPLYVYARGKGYVGYGIVQGGVVAAKDFMVDGKPVLEQVLEKKRFLIDTTMIQKEQNTSCRCNGSELSRWIKQRHFPTYSPIRI